MTSKIFVIGMFKTGLASTEVALEKLGLKVYRNNPYQINQWLQKDIMELASDEFNLDIAEFNTDIIEGMKTCDAGSHHPFMFIYPWLDETFPGSRFILTQRDVSHVIRSTNNVIQFCKKGMVSNQKISDRYTFHQGQVLNYFKNRQKDLLIMNYENKDGWIKLCSFLKIPCPNISIDFPWVNKSFNGGELIK